jgi:3-deoxy-7-phosphoheptulonate synthase
MRQEYVDIKAKMSRLKVGALQPKTVVRVGNHRIGGDTFTLIAGPCAVENLDQMHVITQAVKASGAHILRGGAYKPRTSPYNFQGLGEEGLELLKEMSLQYDIPVITELVDIQHLEKLALSADIIQIGSRNMQNYALLQALGQVERPIMLKRGIAATIEEFLLAAEYIINAGNPNVILCERGIRTYETVTRNTLDLNAVAILKQLTHLPIIVDPSHGTGVKEIMGPMAKAALACGADGIMLEVHHQPEKALSDGAQALIPTEFATIVKELSPLAHALQRKIHHV